MTEIQAAILVARDARLVALERDLIEGPTIWSSRAFVALTHAAELRLQAAKVVAEWLAARPNYRVWGVIEVWSLRPCDYSLWPRRQ